MQRKIPSIKLNTIYTNEATTCFKSKISLSFINIVQIDVLVDTSNFYIMDIAILFLFYLKDMNTLSIYLNNITNYFICQDNKSVFIICK